MRNLDLGILVRAWRDGVSDAQSGRTLELTRYAFGGFDGEAAALWDRARDAYVQGYNSTPRSV